MKKSNIASKILGNISDIMSNGSISSEKGKALVVFTGSSLDIGKTMDHIFDLKKAGYAVAVGFSFMAKTQLDTKRIITSLNPLAVYGEEDIMSLQLLSNDYSLLLMPNITMNTLSKVCSGTIDTFASNILWAFLYKNKKVVIDFYSVRNYLGDKPASKVIEDMIEERIDSILKMGATELEHDTEIFMDEATVQEPMGEPSRNTVLKEDSSTRKLITEKDIVACKTNRLVVGKNTIVTPLAKDRARELNIELIME